MLVCLIHEIHNQCFFPIHNVLKILGDISYGNVKNLYLWLPVYGIVGQIDLDQLSVELTVYHR